MLSLSEYVRFRKFVWIGLFVLNESVRIVVSVGFMYGV